MSLISFDLLILETSHLSTLCIVIMRSSKRSSKGSVNSSAAFPLPNRPPNLRYTADIVRLEASSGLFEAPKKKPPEQEIPFIRMSVCLS